MPHTLPEKWHYKLQSCNLHMAIGNRANKMSYVIGINDQFRDIKRMLKEHHRTALSCSVRRSLIHEPSKQLVVKISRDGGTGSE